MERRERCKIMFVCEGNICRSPAADGVFNHLAAQRGVADRFSADSCGVGAHWHAGEPPNSVMRRVAAQNGIELNHIARQALSSDFRHYDLFLVMDHNNLRALKSIAPDREARAKIALFRNWDPEGGGEVPDPYYGGIDGFELVYEIVYRTCVNLLERLAGDGDRL